MSITNTHIERVRQVIHKFVKENAKMLLKVTLEVNGHHQTVCYHPQDYTSYEKGSKLEIYLSVHQDKLDIELGHTLGEFKKLREKIITQIPQWKKITNPHRPSEPILEETTP